MNVLHWTMTCSPLGRHHRAVSCSPCGGRSDVWDRARAPSHRRRRDVGRAHRCQDGKGLSRSQSNQRGIQCTVRSCPSSWHGSSR
eukprot:scaffold721_cov235-Pinguiococcus_pyrenoidosus.AAC.9